MSSSEAVRLLEDLNSNPDLKAKLADLGSMEESLKYIKSQGYDVTIAEIVRAEHKTVASLTDEQLTTAVGGSGCVQTYATTLCTIGAS